MGVVDENVTGLHRLSREVLLWESLELTPRKDAKGGRHDGRF